MMGISMNILFYQKKLEETDYVSFGVHMIEVLNYLSKQGHNIIFVDGNSYSFIGLTRTHTGMKSIQTKSYFQRINRIIQSSPLKGEIRILFYLIKEIQFFLSAFKTLIRNKPDIIYRRHNLFSSEYILSRVFKIPCVKEVNGIITDEIRITRNGDRFSLFLSGAIENCSLRAADQYIVVTAKLKNVLQQDFKIHTNKIFIIENGANTDLFKPIDKSSATKALNIDKHNTYLCYVGMLYPWQGIDRLISAMPFVIGQFPEVRLLIVGDGQMKTNLLDQAKKLNIESKILFVGKVPYDTVPYYVNAGEICLCPTATEQRNIRTGASPLKMCEYLACGKPVIASRASGLEFIEENNCGYLVNTESAQEFADKIIELLRDPQLARKMGENGRLYVLKNRGWDVVSEKVATVCEKAIEARRKS
jgi:glycosyltransferase involved in cell wall biosynthesis